MINNLDFVIPGLIRNPEHDAIRALPWTPDQVRGDGLGSK